MTAPEACEVVDVAEAIVDVAHAEILAEGLSQIAEVACNAVDELRAHRRLTPGELAMIEDVASRLDLLACFMLGGTVRPCL